MSLLYQWAVFKNTPQNFSSQAEKRARYSHVVSISHQLRAAEGDPRESSQANTGSWIFFRMPCSGEARGIQEALTTSASVCPCALDMFSLLCLYDGTWLSTSPSHTYESHQSLNAGSKFLGQTMWLVKFGRAIFILANQLWPHTVAQGPTPVSIQGEWAAAGFRRGG